MAGSLLYASGEDATITLLRDDLDASASPCTSIARAVVLRRPNAAHCGEAIEVKVAANQRLCFSIRPTARTHTR